MNCNHISVGEGNFVVYRPFDDDRSVPVANCSPRTPCVFCKLCPNAEGAATILLKRYYNRFTQTWHLTIYLGKERHGKYAGKYNLFSGNRDFTQSGHRECVMITAARELYEEAGIYAGVGKYNDVEWSVMRTVYQSIDSDTVTLNIHHNTPVFAIALSNSITRTELNNVLVSRKNDPNVPFCMKEIEEIDGFLSNMTPIDNAFSNANKYAPVTDYARSVAGKIINFLARTELANNCQL